MDETASTEVVEECRPRLCHLIIRDRYEGYGFNLHAERSRPGQYIGKIDENSPAEAAGLKEGDRIVQVNGVNISQENHKQVVSRIKSLDNETKLLVVDRETDEYYAKIGEIIKEHNAIKLSSFNDDDDDDHEILNNDDKNNEDDRRSQVSSIDDNKDDSTTTPRLIMTEATIETPPPPTSTLPEVENDDPPPPSANTLHNNDVPKSNDDEYSESSDVANFYDDEKSTKPKSNSSPKIMKRLSSNGGSVASSEISSSTSMSPRSTPSPDMHRSSSSTLNLNMTAAEMREKISARKKRDPRKDNRIDFRKKLEIIQTL